MGTWTGTSYSNCCWTNAFSFLDIKVSLQPWFSQTPGSCWTDVTQWYNRIDTVRSYRMHYSLCAPSAYCSVQLWPRSRNLSICTIVPLTPKMRSFPNSHALTPVLFKNMVAPVCVNSSIRRWLWGRLFIGVTPPNRDAKCLVRKGVGYCEPRF